jgi:hypothetical protein
MFSSDDVKSEKIDGVKVYTFTPNTITYAVPVDTDLGKKVKDAKIGIVWHTSYSGSTLDSLNGSFSISGSQYKNTKDVYTRNTNVTLDTIAWSPDQEKYLRKSISNLENDLRSLKGKIEPISGDKKLSSIIKTYINQKVRDGNNKFNKNEIKGLIDYIYLKYDKAKEKLKSEKGKMKKETEKKDFVSNLRDHASTLYHLFDFSYNIQGIKTEIIRKLMELNSSETPYIQQSDGSYAITEPEGFVLSDSPESGTKFVNRDVFSKNNFSISRF